MEIASIVKGLIMNFDDFPQVPLPEQHTFQHNHECTNCKEWKIFGTLTYSNEIENTMFICKDCIPPFNFIPLPKKTEFRESHECAVCHKKSKKILMTYCPKCEDGEFVCSLHVKKWFDRIYPDEYGYEYRPKFD